MTTHNHPQNEGNDPAITRHMKRLHYWDNQRLQKLGDPDVPWEEIPEEGRKALYHLATNIKDMLDAAEGDKYIAMMACAAYFTDEDSGISTNLSKDEAALLAGRVVNYYLRPTPDETTFIPWNPPIITPASDDAIEQEYKEALK